MLIRRLVSFAGVLACTVAQSCFSQCQQDSLAFAYQYGYPLYAYGVFALGTGIPTNFLGVSPALATSDSRNVVRPNVDTLYAVMFYDLSQSSLEITVPKFDDRLWLFPFYDMYANNFCNIGSIGGHKPGRYLLRFADNNFGLQTQDINATFQGYVNSPTPYGLLLIRIEAFNPTSDIDRIHEFTRNITVTPRKRVVSSGIPAFNLSMFSDVLRTNRSLGEKVLNLTAQLARYNKPEVLADRAWVAETLTNAGISNGTFKQPKDTNMTAAVEVANSSSIFIATQAGFNHDLGNDWTQLAPQISGDFRSFYNARHLVAITGYLQLTADQALYPRYTQANLNIQPNQAYLFTYLSKPQLEATGFWSLTVYGADFFFIPNDLDRYALGDRSNLTYPDGTLVYEDADSTGPFQILVQPADVPPPANWTSNWLPGPPGGGQFSVSFRLYGASPSMTDGSWEYPVVTIVDAITE